MCGIIVGMTQEEIEFIGFFYGEGCITIQRVNHRGNPVFRLRISISSREDDSYIIDWAKEKFGGYTYRYGKRVMKTSGYISNPVKVWIVDSRVLTRKILELLRKGKLKSTKNKQVLLGLEFLDYQENREGKNRKLKPEQIEICEDYKQKLQLFKKYSNVTD